jgi:ribosomal protein S9
MGMARALMLMKPDSRPALAKAVSTHPRKAQKPGLKRARKAPTYTKR